jgi:hypothetical protein
MGAKTFPVYWKEQDYLEPGVRNFFKAPVGQFFISIRMFVEYIACCQIRNDFAAK